SENPFATCRLNSEFARSSIRRGCSARALRRERDVAVGAAVTEELPHLAHFQNHIEVEVRDQHLVFIPAGLGNDLAARIAKVALSIELADRPRLLRAHAIDSAYEILVRDRVRRLLQFP